MTCLDFPLTFGNGSPSYSFDAALRPSRGDGYLRKHIICRDIRGSCVSEMHTLPHISVTSTSTCRNDDEDEKTSPHALTLILHLQHIATE